MLFSSKMLFKKPHHIVSLVSLGLSATQCMVGSLYVVCTALLMVRLGSVRPPSGGGGGGPPPRGGGGGGGAPENKKHVLNAVL